MAAKPQDSITGEGASPEAVPPSRGTTLKQNVDVRDVIAEAEIRRYTLQSEAAIQLAIGVCIDKLAVVAVDFNSLGHACLTVSDVEVMRFSKAYRVTAEEVDGNTTYTVVPREGEVS